MSDKKELESQDEPSSEIPQSLTNVELDNLTKQTNVNKQKIDIFLKATGNAPIMKIKKWAVPPERTIGKIVEFMRKYLHLDSKESLFLYINQAFAPSPDQTVRNLYECYGTDGKLVLHYCKSPAWG